MTPGMLSQSRAAQLSVLSPSASPCAHALQQHIPDADGMRAASSPIFQLPGAASSAALPAVGATDRNLSCWQSGWVPKAAQPGSEAAWVQGAPCHCLPSVPLLDLLFCVFCTLATMGGVGVPRCTHCPWGTPSTAPWLPNWLLAAPETLPYQT